jgi:hypothetical protein
VFVYVVSPSLSLTVGKSSRKRDQGPAAKTSESEFESGVPRVQHQEKQATSNKQQVTSNKQQATTSVVELTRVLVDVWTPLPGQNNTKLSIEIFR